MPSDLLLVDTPCTIDDTDDTLVAALRGRLPDSIEVVVRGEESPAAFYEANRDRTRWIIGQPPLTRHEVTRYQQLQAVFEPGGLGLDDAAHADCRRLGIQLLTPNQVLARPVGELALGFALSLLRDIHGGDRAFREGRERYGPAGVRGHGALRGRSLGFVGFGALARGILEAFQPYMSAVRVHDSRVSRWELEQLSAEPATLAEVLEQSDIVIGIASLNASNRGLIGRREFASMKQGALFLLLSQAALIDFDALREACEEDRLLAASDVFPHQPVAPDDPLRRTRNLLLSAHHGGALQCSRHAIGIAIAEDIELMLSGGEARNCQPISEAAPAAETLHR